jgi:type I restriction enzyme R subunit
VIPYIDELTKSIDYDMATDRSAGNKLKHMIILMQKLPEFMAEIKQKYDPIIALD